MDAILKKLLDEASTRRITANDRAKQRINFAFGNALEGADHFVSKKSLIDADRRVRTQKGLRGSKS